MKTLNYAEVAEHAASMGLRLDTVGNGAAEDRWWLVSTYNWATTEHGRSLAEINAELDERDEAQDQ